MSAQRITRLPPLSGRDRRHFAREAARAGSAYDEMMRQAESKRAEADEALKAADRIECEAWSGALRFGLDVQRTSPTLGQAINAGYTSLTVQCNQCRQYRAVDLTKLKLRPDRRLWSLESTLFCQPCRAANEADTARDGKHRWKPRAVITDIAPPYRPAPEPDPAPSLPTSKRSTP